MLQISPGNPINPLPQVTQVFHRIPASLAWDLWIVKLNIDKHQAGGDPDCHILMGRVGYLHHGTPWLKPDPGVENTALFVFNASLPPAAVNVQFKRVQIVLFVNVHYICIYIIYIIQCVYVCIIFRYVYKLGLWWLCEKLLYKQFMARSLDSSEFCIVCPWSSWGSRVRARFENGLLFIFIADARHPLFLERVVQQFSRSWSQLRLSCR